MWQNASDYNLLLGGKSSLKNVTPDSQFFEGVMLDDNKKKALADIFRQEANNDKVLGSAGIKAFNSTSTLRNKNVTDLNRSQVEYSNTFLGGNVLAQSDISNQVNARRADIAYQQRLLDNMTDGKAKINKQNQLLDMRRSLGDFEVDSGLSSTSASGSPSSSVTSVTFETPDFTSVITGLKSIFSLLLYGIRVYPSSTGGGKLNKLNKKLEDDRVTDEFGDREHVVGDVSQYFLFDKEVLF